MNVQLHLALIMAIDARLLVLDATGTTRVMFLGKLPAPLVLAQGIGRLGCWSAGCCWGRVVQADHPLAVVFTDHVLPTDKGYCSSGTGGS